MNSAEITLVLPTHNEELGIIQLLDEIKSFASNQAYSLRVFVSEDGSTDKTRQVVEAFIRATDSQTFRVELSAPAGRLGYSKGVLRGLEACTSEIICFIDSDGQCNPSEVNLLLERLNPGSIIIGVRTPRRDGLNRLLYSRLFRVAFRLFGGPRLEDPSSPFILAYRKDLRQFLDQISPKLSFGFWWEFQLRANKNGMRIIEVPITHRARFIGETQVYKTHKLPKIIISHLFGLYLLRRELQKR